MEEMQEAYGRQSEGRLAAGSNGELERLAEIFNEYNVPYRLGTRASRACRHVC